MHVMGTRAHLKAPDDKSVHDQLSDRLKGTKQITLCGACHTHVNARDWAHDLDATDAPEKANERIMGFVAYEQDTLLDEGIAGQHRRFAKAIASKRRDARASNATTHIHLERTRPERTQSASNAISRNVFARAKIRLLILYVPIVTSVESVKHQSRTKPNRPPRRQDCDHAPFLAQYSPTEAIPRLYTHSYKCQDNQGIHWKGSGRSQVRPRLQSPRTPRCAVASPWQKALSEGIALMRYAMRVSNTSLLKQLIDTH